MDKLPSMIEEAREYILPLFLVQGDERSIGWKGGGTWGQRSSSQREAMPSLPLMSSRPRKRYRKA